MSILGPEGVHARASVRSRQREGLAGRDRTVAGPTAPPQGLVFVGPLYPDNWQLPAEVT